jgi:hypothetical protein
MRHPEGGNPRRICVIVAKSSLEGTMCQIVVQNEKFCVIRLRALDKRACSVLPEGNLRGKITYALSDFRSSESHNKRYVQFIGTTIEEFF